ncbi:MAG: DUF4389 domain-containing protein [Chloroflexi bacterium]|nr:DUF4389 domain-containing protein [Chloroflexota bacterium]
MTTIPAEASRPYPVNLLVESQQSQRKVTVFFRLIYAIPHFFLLFFLGIAAVVVTLIAWFVILIAGTYPEGMLGFSIGVHRWSNRVIAYVHLLTDQYPPFSLDDDPAYPVRFVAAVVPGDRHRVTTLFRIILAVPHLIIANALGTVASVVAILGWFAILFTGSMPDGLRGLIVASIRWRARVFAYVSLVADEYPPFVFEK